MKRKELDKKDLKSGDIVVYGNSNVCEYPSGASIPTHPKTIYYNHNPGFVWNLKIEEATKEEKDHLLACKEARRWVPRNLTKDDLIDKRWYYCEYDNGKNPFLLKYNADGKGEFSYSEFVAIKDKQHSLFNGGNDISCVVNLRAATKEEIDKYVPNKNNKDMNNLLEEAKRRFPPGTIFNSLGGYRNIEIPKDVIHTQTEDDIRLYSPSNSHLGIVWCADKWAEIIKEASPKESSPTFKVGDYVIMEKAAGWCYAIKNNGCLAKVTGVRKRKLFAIKEEVTSISGIILNPNVDKYVEFTNIPVINNERETVIRPATQWDKENAFGLVKGKFYYYKETKYNNEWIFKYAGLNNNTILSHAGICLTTKYFYSEDDRRHCHLDSLNTSIKLATPEQIGHLKDCIYAEKFVPYESPISIGEFPLISDPDYKVGDRVKIVDCGETYPTYSYAFTEIGFKNKKENPEREGEGAIFHICKHENKTHTMFAVMFDNGDEILIDKKGIAKVEEEKGEYLVALIDEAISIRCINKGDILQRIDDLHVLFKGTRWACNKRGHKGELKSFNSLEEAEAFAKTLKDNWYYPYTSKEEFDAINNHFNKGWAYREQDGYCGYTPIDGYNNWSYESNVTEIPLTKISRDEFIKYIGKDIFKVYKEDIKVGDIVWSDCPNVCKNKFKGVGGVIGEVLGIEDDQFRISVKEDQYPFYRGSHIWCYGGIIRKATKEEVAQLKIKQRPVVPEEAYMEKEYTGTIYPTEGVERFKISSNGDWDLPNIGTSNPVIARCNKVNKVKCKKL